MHERDLSNREKQVDVALAYAMARRTLRGSPGVLTLVSGDVDYFPVVLGASEDRWLVETWFWNAGKKLCPLVLIELSKRNI